MTSWMQKLRDAHTETERAADIAAPHLEAFLDHFQNRSVWTDRMIPVHRKGPVSLLSGIKVIKAPDKSKVAHGAHVHYVLNDRVIVFNVDTFLNFLNAKGGYNINVNMITTALKKTHHATTHQGTLLRGTPWQHVYKSRIITILVAPGSPLERRLYGENSPAVENAMQVFERGLELRAERAARNAAKKRAEDAAATKKGKP